MKDDIGKHAAEGLERLCGEEERVQMLRSPALPGIEFLEARFFGNVFEPHRHDTYAIGLTMGGVQRFCYRGEERRSLPGQILVLHPDEKHDGGAGTDSGLYYRMLYIEPSLLARSLMPRGVTMPFVGAPVFDDERLRRSLEGAFERFDAGLGTLMADDLVAEVTEGLLWHAGEKPAAGGAVPKRQADIARDFIDGNFERNIHSAELEALTGTDRFLLSRAFRASFGTSPHRYLLMRRLRQSRQLIEDGMPLAEIAAAMGFADQSHLTRHFKKAYGLTPGRWSLLVRGIGVP